MKKFGLHSNLSSRLVAYVSIGKGGLDDRDGGKERCFTYDLKLATGPFSYE